MLLIGHLLYKQRKYVPDHTGHLTWDLSPDRSTGSFGLHVRCETSEYSARNQSRNPRTTVQFERICGKLAPKKKSAVNNGMTLNQGGMMI